MERVSLSADVHVSRIIYGMWRLAEDEDTSPSHVRAKIDACLAQGITTLDQADIYGGYAAEALLGAAFEQSPGLRDDLQIITKCDIVAPVGKYAAARVKHYDTSAAHITASVEASLSNMRIEQIDVLLIHRPDPMMDARETGAALDALIDSGKIKTAGVSNFKPWDWDLLQAHMKHPLVSNQLELSLAARDSFTNGDLAHAQQHGVRPMAWSPLGGGSLMTQQGEPGLALEKVAEAQGVDRAAVAVAWLLAHPSGILPVMGTNTLPRIATFSDATKVEMDRQTWFELFEAANGHEVP
ncbi:oxidoreductase [Roseobacter denitrificans]|uniref:Oxidoreductase, putative n=1 Tax=Roseobacter denitrificans (strain ATCC 33942 / OCh 114) TaxID=375451 RepID=Q167F2_ROSDO|nr:aldo/keto reductase [Roseobacter denitrificans]ABG31891.1 oxidoreductase, putative [Roseobacter denitrificans OCh 114]AVL51443.1 oxidoreductase [Roseobacter denitrificans]SFG42347.1 Predicted oxidoreductase [Roseobacter denitrificans OCh 114]